jgi:hypothetical protein
MCSWDTIISSIVSEHVSAALLCTVDGSPFAQTNDVPQLRDHRDLRNLVALFKPVAESKVEPVQLNLGEQLYFVWRYVVVGQL